jgi:hypothetical protein
MLPLLDNHSAKHSRAIVYYSYLHPVLKILIQQHVKSECFPSIKHCTLPKQHSNHQSIHLPAPLLYPTREWNNDKPWSHTPCSKISNLYQKQTVSLDGKPSRGSSIRHAFSQKSTGESRVAVLIRRRILSLESVAITSILNCEGQSVRPKFRRGFDSHLGWPTYQLVQGNGLVQTKFVRVLLSMGTSICSTFQRQCPGNKVHPRVPSSPLGLTMKFLELGGSCTEADLIVLVKQQAQQ